MLTLGVPLLQLNEVNYRIRVMQIIATHCQTYLTISVTEYSTS